MALLLPLGLLSIVAAAWVMGWGFLRVLAVLFLVWLIVLALMLAAPASEFTAFGTMDVRAWLAGGVILLHRRLYDPRIRATSSFADIGILALLDLQLVLGLLTIVVSAQHLDGGEMVRFMGWTQAIFTFRTDAWLLVAEASWIFKLHIFLGLTIFVLFPFTRLVHMLSVPVRYLWRPGYQIVRSRKAHPAPAARPHPAE